MIVRRLLFGESPHRADVATAAPVTAFAARVRLTTNAVLVAMAVFVFAWTNAVTGQIEVNNGRGWDGGEYATMLEEGWTEGTVNTALRPLIVLLNRPAFSLTGNAVQAFRLMNFVYVALLCLSLCLLLDVYGIGAGIKALVVTNVLLCISTLKYAAYYPVLIDVGGLALIVLATYLIASGRRLAAAVACLAAVMAREFAIAVLAFGIVRDLRLRTPLRLIVATYVPAIAGFLVWRQVVIATIGWDGMITVGRMLTNLPQWLDPVFVALFVYFLLTVCGGVSLFVFARAGLVAAQLRREPEWAAYVAAVMVPALLGNADIWRYLAYLLPAFAVLFAVGARELGLPRRRVLVAAAVCIATIVTQRPLQALDVAAYFRDWFPYYVQLERVPPEGMDPEIWPLWAWRFLAAAGLCWVLATFPPLTAPSADADHV